MARRTAGDAMLDQLTTLYRVGIVGDLPDGELLRRFLAATDPSAQEAFAALVDRHGPMVLRTVRHVLGNAHDADDAFQATFLLLARKAGSVREADSVAGWLHGVARRVAFRARTVTARRRSRERQGSVIEGAVARSDFGPSDGPWTELHEEIAGLPRRYREPIVLCYLEGLTTEVTARRLGCPQGTVMSRLSRGRDRLRARLTRRGLGHDALATAPLTWLGAGTIPASLRATTVAASSGFAHGPTAGAVVASISAKALAKGEILAMSLSTLKILAASVLTCSIGLGGARAFGWFGTSGEAGAPPSATTSPPSAAPTSVAPKAAEAPDDEAARELSLLEGTWVVKKVTFEGKVANDSGLNGSKLTFRSNELTMERNNEEGKARYTLKLDTASRPRAFFTNRVEPARQKSGWMIYELVGDGLKIGFNDALVGGRPEGFEPSPNFLILELERESKEAPAAAAGRSKETPAFVPWPRVAKVSPDDGEVDVDPTTRELRVTFTQDMNQGGMSIAGGGPTFPADPKARARWIDARTIVLPLRLEAGREYHLSINSERFRNFRSIKGEPAVPYPIRFRTGKGK